MEEPLEEIPNEEENVEEESDEEEERIRIVRLEDND